MAKQSKTKKDAQNLNAQTEYPAVDVVIRRKKGYTNLLNWAPDDMTLSDKALGLYTRIQRWITYEAPGFICSKAFIRTKTPSGTKAFDAAWNELKERGYLKMYCHLTPRAVWSAELLDEPQPDAAHTYYYNANGEVIQTNETMAEAREKRKQTDAEGSVADQIPEADAANMTEAAEPVPNYPDATADASSVVCENGSDPPEIKGEDGISNDENSVPPFLGVRKNEANFRTPHFGGTGNGNTGNRYTGNGGNYINTLVNTLINTNLTPIDNLSILNAQKTKFSGEADAIDKMDYPSAIKMAKEQIDYDTLRHDFETDPNGSDKLDILDLIVDRMAEVYSSTALMMKISGNEVATESVRLRFRELDMFHVSYVMESLLKTKSSVLNIPAYITKSLWNAPKTIGTYYTMAVHSAT